MEIFKNIYSDCPIQAIKRHASFGALRHTYD